ncbi:MAG: hypothetical protein M3323_16220 [Actinomycetota bacterium]|nr:hypothetical protein [Actinomycetota bacterium]
MYVAERDEDISPPMYSLFVRNELHYRSQDVTGVLAHAVWDLHQLVPKNARDFLFLHAGAVARDGGALVLPARMDSGKSSLVTALLRSGWGYLSDELGSIDPVTGRIYAFPKLISLDAATLGFFPGLAESLPDGSATPLPERFLAPEDVGSSVAAPAAPRWIVFPTKEWKGDARLTPVTSAAAVERMAKNSFNLYRYGERGVILLSRTAAAAQSFELTGGTPAERAELLTRELI